MVVLSETTIIVIIVSGVVSGLCVRCLSFLLKSRCSEIRCFGMYCKREVIESKDISKRVLEEIEVPSNLIQIRK